MAQREALREFQSRLASRLQAAHATGAQAAWLAVEAGDARYLLPLAQSGEIFPFHAPQPVPHTRPWFLGVASLRGGLWGVVDLAAFAQDRAPSAADRTEARLIALGASLEFNCALLIDRLAGLRGPESFASPQPAPGGSPEWFGPVYTDPQDTSWQALDLQALAREPRFLAIAG